MAFFDNDIHPPERVALVLPNGATLSRHDLSVLEQDLLNDIKTCGLTRGQRVAILLPDCWQYPILTLALSEMCSVMPLNPALADVEITRIIGEAGVDALIGEPRDTRVKNLAQTMKIPALSIALEGHSTLCGDMRQASTSQWPSGLVLMTSGSTGHPKRVPVRRDAMLQSAKNIAHTLDLGPKDRALHALPMFHIGAIVDLFLAPMLAGASVAISAGKSPSEINDAITSHGCTWAQLVPTMLARCLADLPTQAQKSWGAKLRFIRSVSSDLSPAQQEQAERAFGNVAIIQMYGMTETAGQICSNPLPPYERKIGTVGQAAGPEIAILDQVGAHVPDGTEGEICVKGPTVMLGYETVESGADFWGDWLRTGDLGQRDEQGYVSITGRLKEMINRGGEKISPVEVERAALTLSQINEAVAFRLPHPTLGEQVGLCVTLQHGATLTETAILEHLNAHLAHHKCPRSVDIRTALPRLGSGKVDRLSLSQRASTKAHDDRPTSELAQKLSKLWQQTLGGDPPQDAQDFFDAGGDSLQAVTFLSALEEELEQSIDPNLLYEAPRFGDLLQKLEAQVVAVAPKDEPEFLTYSRRQISGWKGQRVGSKQLIIAQRTIGDAAPVFLLTQGEYENFLPFLNETRPVFMMRTLFGLKGKSEGVTRELAAILADEITQIYPKGPLHFLSYCEGAKLAHFIAEILASKGRRADLIISVDYDWPREWAAPVLHVQSEKFRRFTRPNLGLRHITRAGSDVVFLIGDHNQALDGPSMPDLALRMESLFNGAEELTQLSDQMPLDARETLYSAKIWHDLPRLFKPNAKGRVTVRVQNTSPHNWAATDDSGIALMLEFYNLDGHARQRIAGYCELNTPLAIGEIRTFEIEFTYPDSFIPLFARISMTDEGLCTFASQKHGYVSRLCWPFAR